MSIDTSPPSLSPSSSSSPPPPPSSYLSPPPPRTLIINLSQRPIPSHPPSLPSSLADDPDVLNDGFFVSFCCGQDLSDPHPTSYTPLVKPPYTQELYDQHLSHAKWLFGIKEDKEEEEEEGQEAEAEKDAVEWGGEETSKANLNDENQRKKKSKSHAQHAHTYEEQSPANKFKEFGFRNEAGGSWQKAEKPTRSFSLSADRPGLTEDLMTLYGEKNE